YTYLASLGWAILAGAGLGSSWRTSSRSRTGTPTALPLAGIATGVVVALGVLTWSQAQVWHDSERLWTHALATGYDSVAAQNNLGRELVGQGEPAEAIEHFQQALRIRPDADADNNWRLALALQGQPPAATGRCREAQRTSRTPCAPTTTMPPPTTPTPRRSPLTTTRPSRTNTATKPYPPTPTMPKPTTAGAARSLPRASRPRRANTSSKPYASSPTIP